MSSTKAKAERGTRAGSSKAAAVPTTKIGLGERIRIRMGDSGAKGVYFATVAAVRAVTMLLFYLASVYLVTMLVPNLVALVQATTGAGIDAGVDAMFAYWIAPSLFLLALVFALVYAGFRAVWRASSRLLIRAKASLIG